MEERVESLSHTADVGFRVESSSLEGLFTGAARGLLGALTDREAGDRAEGPRTRQGDGTTEREELEIARPDRERLLVAWLRELLHRAMSRGSIPEVLEVSFGDDGELRAAIGWSSPDRSPELVREIKGVTYHGLAVRETGEGWSATVVLDV